MYDTLCSRSSIQLEVLEQKSITIPLLESWFTHKWDTELVLVCYIIDGIWQPYLTVSYGYLCPQILLLLMMKETVNLRQYLALAGCFNLVLWSFENKKFSKCLYSKKLVGFSWKYCLVKTLCQLCMNQQLFSAKNIMLHSCPYT